MSVQSWTNSNKGVCIFLSSNYTYGEEAIVEFERVRIVLSWRQLEENAERIYRSDL